LQILVQRLPVRDHEFPLVPACPGLTSVGNIARLPAELHLRSFRWRGRSADAERPPLEAPMARDEMPDLLTVEEAARWLRIGRGLAYTLARRWLAT
jgi:hypothetical protein